MPKPQMRKPIRAKFPSAVVTEVATGMRLGCPRSETVARRSRQSRGKRRKPKLQTLPTLVRCHMQVRYLPWLLWVLLVLSGDMLLWIVAWQLWRA